MGIKFEKYPDLIDSQNPALSWKVLNFLVAEIKSKNKIIIKKKINKTTEKESNFTCIKKRVINISGD